MKDSYNRDINYLRVSITQKCNLACHYCFLEKKTNKSDEKETLTMNEIVDIVGIAARDFNFKKIRLTGGEPLLYPQLIELVELLSSITGIQDLALTTNGILLEELALPLAKAGLHRINISLDTTDPIKYHQITNGGDVRKVLIGIEAAKKAGLEPIKLNCVVNNNDQEENARLIKTFASKNNLQARFIQKMDLKNGKFSKVIEGEGGDCKNCNRLRLLIDGSIRPCLFSNTSFNVKALGIHQALKLAILNKPSKGEKLEDNFMYQIGG